MPATNSKLTPRRLKSIRINEVSLVAQPANVHARALLAKSADLKGQQADAARRLDAIEKRRVLEDAPARLVKAMAQRGAEMAAAARGERYIAPIAVDAVAKNASGGQRLIARCAEVRKAMIAKAIPVEAVQPASVMKAAASPAERLVLAAKERAAAMRKAG